MKIMLKDKFISDDVISVEAIVLASCQAPSQIFPVPFLPHLQLNYY
jgi:hypothetical protein